MLQSDKTLQLFKALMSFVLCLILLLSNLNNEAHSQTQGNDINGIRIWHAPDNSRVVFDMSGKADYSVTLLDNPSRYIIDFKRTALKGNIPVKVPNLRIDQLRAGLIGSNQLRVVIPIQKALSIKSFQLVPNDVYGHRLVLDLFDLDSSKKPLTKGQRNSRSNSDGNSSAIAHKPTPNTPKSQTPSTKQQIAQDYSQPRSIKKKIIIAIDAGHGGEDPGALGSRSQEKNVTLAISRRLAKIINKTPGMEAVLIRTNDYFVQLRNRTKKAHEANADLFVSIHADAALNKSARGMSVFALSQRGASSALARALARKENQADLVGGVSIRDKDDGLAQVLLDLSLTNKISESVELGSFVLKRLSKLGKLHSKRVEQAGFAVLKSPDIPSVLVETGFITNRSEEKRLLSSRFQQQLAQQIYAGLVDYINSNPIQVANANFKITPSTHTIDNFDTAYDANPVSETVYHRIKSGDSLSKIANRYKISLKQLKQWNKLKSNVAVKGKRLRVSPIAKSSQQKPSNVAQSTKLVRYTVKRGDTLSTIAERYGVSMKSIRQRNKLKSSNVFVGQRLNIQTKSPAKKVVNTTKKSSKPKVHKVRSGEHLSSISVKYKISIKRLKQLNKLKSNNIYVGQNLIVSEGSIAPKSSASKTIKHKVRRGQTLSGLALKYGVKQSQIIAWNKLKKRELWIGQTLLITTKK